MIAPLVLDPPLVPLRDPLELPPLELPLPPDDPLDDPLEPEPPEELPPLELPELPLEPLDELPPLELPPELPPLLPPDEPLEEPPGRQLTPCASKMVKSTARVPNDKSFMVFGANSEKFFSRGRV